jgi:hypothetical protein
MGDKYQTYQKRYTIERRTKLFGGLSAKEQEALFKAQKGKCAICLHPLLRPDQIQRRTASVRTHMDHDHKTDAARGFLCSRCNLGLGYFKDSPELLRRAANYIEIPSVVALNIKNIQLKDTF